MSRLAGLARAALDLCRPSLRTEYGGPFNDQRARARLVRELLRSARAIVETGTYRGTTTRFLATLGVPVWSVELEPRFHFYARARTWHLRNVHLSLGDSRAFLASPPRMPRRDVFFYLDAHRPGDDPLRDELAAILAGWERSLILIDDFQVPGDPGYAFNEGLDASAIPPGVRAFYPTTPAAEETGYRRGCVVLATRELRSPLLREI